MTRDFQPDDLHRFREITGIHAVAQAASAACAVLSVDAAGDRYTSAIWRVPLDDGEPRQLSSGLGMDEKPRWSPDGTRLAFLSDRGGSPQIHLMPADGGEARALTSFARGVQAFEWSPDGTRLLAVCPVEVDPDARGERREGKPPERGPNAPEVAWRLPYKADGSGYRLGAETHLFVVDAESGDDTRITDGAFDVGSASWSPDGQQLVYSRSREGRTAHRTDLWIGRALRGEDETVADEGERSDRALAADAAIERAVVDRDLGDDRQAVLHEHGEEAARIVAPAQRLAGRDLEIGTAERGHGPLGRIEQPRLQLGVAGVERAEEGDPATVGRP